MIVNEYKFIGGVLEYCGNFVSARLNRFDGFEVWTTKKNQEYAQHFSSTRSWVTSFVPGMIGWKIPNEGDYKVYRTKAVDMRNRPDFYYFIVSREKKDVFAQFIKRHIKTGKTAFL